jgi:hypothetical protein
MPTLARRFSDEKTAAGRAGPGDGKRRFKEDRMTGNTVSSKIAPLANVVQLKMLIEEISGRHFGLPGLGCFYGPAGYGKSFSAIYMTNAQDV